MPSPLAISAVVVLAIVAIAVYRRMKDPPSPPNCYSWTAFEPSTGRLPAGNIVGLYPTSTLIPAGALNPADNVWYLGLTAVSPASSSWGRLVGSKAGGTGGDISFSPNKIFVLVNADSADCKTAVPPKALASGDTPLKFNGIGVCWNFSQTAGAFTPANADGSCTQWGGMGTYSPIAKM